MVVNVLHLQAKDAGLGIGLSIGGILFGAFIAWCGSPWVKPEPKTPNEPCSGSTEFEVFDRSVNLPIGRTVKEAYNIRA